MVIEIKLLKNKTETPEGFPLVVEVAHQNKRKQKKLCFCKENHFLPNDKMISTRHPDYDVMAPILMDLKIKARKLILQGCTDIEKAYTELFCIDFSQIGMMDHVEKLIEEMKQMAATLLLKKDLKAANKILGNCKVYENVRNQMEPFFRDVAVQGVDYEVLMRFRNYQLGIGNSKATVHLYLRTVRTMYNKGVLLYKLHDAKPFEGVFANLKQKSFSSKKKYLDREMLQKLEALDLKSEKQKYVDLFLLQFYFAGCDLIDIYYLNKKQVRRGRVNFERTKTNTGTRIDLKIHPKAAAILAKFNNDTEYILPYKKDHKAYETFRRTYQRALVYVQKAHGIEIEPTGGNIGAKVARHTFATLGKNLLIEPDILRELMGHERDDVDNYYKDKYPEAMRDDALFKIIG
jgi:Phage integrase SAM-like domain